ncbi:hypothetical protein PAXRUDRAFT_832090 [Paxillus rubicundulus Ve08.2h10]|uniref:Uncharacterized protein n=1 Tax=Paxillus rubicundulus Ve08.2h10 TaxID=930991 RepID=A0A0D0DMD9_9AGAM|nr:hypothetical protein PAXRUDRAFT_832090 [Paxillus rubicundulus Ve08.2h10]
MIVRRTVPNVHRLCALRPGLRHSNIDCTDAALVPSLGLGSSLFKGIQPAEVVGVQRDVLRLFPRYKRARFNAGVTCEYLFPWVALVVVQIRMPPPIKNPSRVSVALLQDLTRGQPGTCLGTTLSRQHVTCTYLRIVAGWWIQWGPRISLIRSVLSAWF